MLIQPLDLFDVDPPFLIVFGNGEWRVARELQPHPEGVAYVEPFTADPEDPARRGPDGVVPGSPWYVGAGIWEMDFNARIMTLDHPHQRRHPAWQLWLQWLDRGPHNVSARTH